MVRTRIPSADAALWERHNFQPQDECPLCGGVLVKETQRALLPFKRARSWLVCNAAPMCDFSVRTRA
jgi:ssDNA-binding Zn-finger/Zn-ribbon topoisomerase 1